MVENKLIASAGKSRDAWDRVCKYANVKEFSPYNACVFEAISEYYTKDPDACQVDQEVILERLRLKFKDNAKHEEAYCTHAKDVLGLDVSASNIIDLLIETKKDEVGRKLGIALINKQDEDKVPELIAQYEELCNSNSLDDGQEEEEEYNNVSVETIVSKTLKKESLIAVSPPSLNEVVDGGCLPGHHIVIYARPECGKSAFVITNMVGFAAQGLPGIYFGNEDPIYQIIQRTMSSMCGADKAQLAQYPKRAEELLKARGWEHIRFIPLAPGTPREIEKYVARYHPSWIVVDQLRNVLVPGAGTKTEQLEEAAKAVRRMCQKYKLLGISVTQAGDSASNKLVLDQGDVDSSNTGIPGQADLMIGQGVNAEYEQQGYRVLATPKNKISGKHVHFRVKIQPHLSRIIDG